MASFMFAITKIVSSNPPAPKMSSAARKQLAQQISSQPKNIPTEDAAAANVKVIGSEARRVLKPVVGLG